MLHFVSGALEQNTFQLMVIINTVSFVALLNRTKAFIASKNPWSFKKACFFKCCFIIVSFIGGRYFQGANAYYNLLLFALKK